MESILPIGGLGLPLPKRLSRLYNDTKKSSDFVKEPVQNAEDPEIKALHRKLRIQKDRFVSWGLEWSDPNHSAEIDESLSKAGLSDLVGSIMSTIKDILAEAEPLWLSSKRLVGGDIGGAAGKAPMDIKAALVVWDKGRFEDLVRDLTTSIDTLYDLSRTRSTGITAAMAKSGAKTAPQAEDLRPFESSRMQTPQELDPKTLTNATTMEPGPLILGNGTRDVVFMSKQAYSDLTHNSRPWAPLLLEYAEFDPIFAATGIMPSMSKFEKLCEGLQMDSPRQSGAWNGLPHLLGFFEDIQHARLGLVYQFPATFNPVSQSKGRQNTCSLFSLADLLARPDFEPTLEAKFRLANNLANTVFDMHARGVSHGNLNDQSIVFCNTPGTNDIDIRKPVISSFELFSDSPYQDQTTQTNLYRHPLDPRTTEASPLSKSNENKSLDLFSLAMILSSIATWCSLENLVPNAASPSVSESILPLIAIRCGTLYMKAVQACWNAVDEELSGKVSGEVLLKKVEISVCRYLEACCILDSVSGLEDRLRDDLGESAARAAATASVAGPSKKGVSVDSTPAQLPSEEKLEPVSLNEPRQEKVVELVEQPSNWPLDIKRDLEAAQLEISKKKTPKTRLYPNVPLPGDAIEQCHDMIIPQVNAALKSFYKKNVESVEISLESIGESPQTARPTVLVVCTSVPKVRAILKKKLGALFDGSTQFSLKVCKGQVLRSRNSYARRSMAGSKSSVCESAASSQSYQARPHNGASIGAWIGVKHLPPVSFGGLIVVDNKRYGMTVHHMLDDPEMEGVVDGEPIMRSSGWGQHMQGLSYEGSHSGSNSDSDYACEFDDDEDEEELDESDITSDDEDEDEDEFEPGDIPGIEPGCGDGYIVTQPAIDDVGDGFFASDETADEEHLDSFSVGEVYASSGIRRREQHGLIHEIDWALFEFEHERVPDENSIPSLLSASPTNSEIHPTTVAPTSSLPGLEVQCIARTSGLQTGKIMPALSSVKIYGRTSPSHTYQVCRASNPLPEAGQLPLGIPGDSGAWIVDRRQGRLCGHVLAWSERKQVAYICPMDVLLLDIAEALEATEVKLPGGDAVVQIELPDGDCSREEDNLAASRFSIGDDELEDLLDDESDAPALVQRHEQQQPQQSSFSSSTAAAARGAQGPSQYMPPGKGDRTPNKPGFEDIGVRELDTQMDRLKLGQGVGVKAPV
ncbi:hypothetical protein MKZ38_010619 [Zalerion maritima]|uniref:Uncharacterized protein n=1 Tax=Zalerion maritima TaxID=339359 RepID=A0AAD5RTH3_9PEZI|nr:hypothetical protein MKZ38_010619 [Zalerion maritima]